MSKYQPESWRTNASQNALGRPHIVDSPGTGVAVPNASRMSSARTADTARTPSAIAATRASVRTDKRFGQAHRFGVGERLIQSGERIRAGADRAPRNRGVMRLERAQRADEMADLAAPAAANLEVLAVDLLMHVDRARSRVGIVSR